MANDRTTYIFQFSIILIIFGVFLFWIGYMNLDVGFYEGAFNLFYAFIMIIGLSSVIVGLSLIIWCKKNKDEFKTKILLLITIIIIFILLTLPIIYKTFFVHEIIM